MAAAVFSSSCSPSSLSEEEKHDETLLTVLTRRCFSFTIRATKGPSSSPSSISDTRRRPRFQLSTFHLLLFVLSFAYLLSTSSVLCHRPRTKRFPRVPAGRRSIETARLSHLNHRTVRTLSRGKRCPSRCRPRLVDALFSSPAPDATTGRPSPPSRVRSRFHRARRRVLRRARRFPKRPIALARELDAIVVRFRRATLGRHRYLFRFLFPDEISSLSFFLSFFLSMCVVVVVSSAPNETTTTRSPLTPAARCGALFRAVGSRFRNSGKLCAVFCLQTPPPQKSSFLFYWTFRFLSFFLLSCGL